MSQIEDNTTLDNDSDSRDEQVQLVSFTIGEEEFAVDITAVREINRMLEITRVPDAPDHVEGVINLRGLIVPVVDMRKLFGIHTDKVDGNTRIMVMELQDRLVGFIVDQVNEVLRLNTSIIEPAGNLASSEFSQYISGIGKLDNRLLILLQVEHLLSQSDLCDASVSV